MRILYDYTPYDKPKMAAYNQTGDKYLFNKKEGYYHWESIQREAIVIGETEHCYVEQLIEHQICDTSEPDYGEIVLLPMGFHKSRLVKWKESPIDQLQLF